MYFVPLVPEVGALRPLHEARRAATALKARTGELTPPGIRALARSNSSRLRSMAGASSVCGSWGGQVEGLQRLGFVVSRFVVVGLRPEQAVRATWPCRGESRHPAAVEVGQRFGRRLRSGRCHSRSGRTRWRQGVSAPENGLEALEFLATRTLAATPARCRYAGRAGECR